MKMEGLDGREHILFYLKDDEHGWLSNFFPSTIRIRGRTYQTVEHFYQSKKAVEKDVENWIAVAPKPYMAMKAGRNLRAHEFQSDWDIARVDIMRDGLFAKFGQNLHLYRLLLDTGDAILHEDSPTDMFWGMKGRDMLGKLLMEVRGMLRNENP